MKGFVSLLGMVVGISREFPANALTRGRSLKLAKLAYHFRTCFLKR